VVACGVRIDRLDVLDQDWEEAFFVEKSLTVSPLSSPRAEHGVT
jgi:hypothetical protein